MSKVHIQDSLRMNAIGVQVLQELELRYVIQYL